MLIFLIVVDGWSKVRFSDDKLFENVVPVKVTKPVMPGPIKYNIPKIIIIKLVKTK